MIGGVSGGLAEYSGIDALLWRVGFVALTLAGGTGVIVYLLLWLLMPAGPPAGAGHAPVARREPRRPAGPRSPVPGITIAALLIVVGVLALLITGSPTGTSDPAASSAPRCWSSGSAWSPRPSPPAGRRAAGSIALGVVLSAGLLIAASTEPWRGARGRRRRPDLPAAADAATVQPVYDVRRRRPARST